MGNNKMKRQHQHNFLFFLFFLRSIRKFSVRGPFYSISWLQIIIFLLFVSIPIGGAPSLLFGPCHAAMYEIIDCSQIFHVISKIKSSNYRAHAYFSIHPEKNWAKRTTEITLWKLEWILMGRNLRASVSVVLPKLQQLNLSPMRSQYLSAKCQFINCYVCWGAINIKSHRCDITAEAILHRPQPQQYKSARHWGTSFRLLSKIFPTHQQYKSQFRRVYVFGKNISIFEYIKK